MITSKVFGLLPDGQQVMQFSLINDQGMQVDILTLGGIIRRWLVPSPVTGSLTDIVLGFDTLEDYLADQAYVGAVVGRYANRIAKGEFALEGKRYHVNINQGGHCLHGGSEGFNRRLCQAEVLADGDEPTLALSLVSPDGDQGFPGHLSVKVTYSLSSKNCLKVEYSAISDADTLFNPTQHSYFNLGGHQSGAVINQQIQVLASHYTPTDPSAIPTGEIATVTGSPFDLRQLTPIATPLNSTHEQIKIGNGLDHNWCLDAYKPGMQRPQLAAVATDHSSGISLMVSTTMPGMQVYTGNYLSATPLGKGLTVYGANHAFCFESQFYPDAANQQGFPSPTLSALERFYSCTEYAIEF